MKRSLLVLTPLAALILSSGAFAQGRYIGLDDNRTSTLDVDFNGEADLNYTYQDAVIRELADDGGTAPIHGAWTAGGLGLATLGAVGNPGGHSKEGADFFWGRLTLRVQTHIADNVHAFLELETQSLDAGFIQPWGLTGGHAAESSTAPHVEQLYVDINQLWDDHVSFRIGRQDVIVDMRGADRSGGAFFADLSEAESAWHGINLAGFTPSGAGVSVTRGRPVTFRDTMEPVGVRFRYESIAEDSIDFKVWLLPVVGNEDIGGEAPDEDEAMYMANLDWYLPDIGEDSKLMVLVAWMQGGDGGAGTSGLTGTGRDMDVITFGLGIDVRGIGDPGLELFGELYFQTGSAGRTAALAFPGVDGIAGTADDIAVAGGQKLDAGGMAFNVGLRYESLETRGHPWFEVSYSFHRGDDKVGTGDGDYQGFISYENVDDFAIVEGNDLGLDVDTNYSAIKVKGGLRFSSEHGQDNIHLDLKVGFFSFDEEINGAQATAGAVAGVAGAVAGAGGAVLTPSFEDDLGMEVDAKLMYHFNDQLSFHILLAFLAGAEALEGFTADTDDNTWMMNVGMNLRF